METPTPPATAAGVTARSLGPLLVHEASRPARTARPNDWPSWVDLVVRDRMEQAGVAAPWPHQRAAAEHAWAGGFAVLATPTASGKSLAYQLPALTWARTARPRQRLTTLYVSPTKALAADQAASIEGLGVPDVATSVVDGDATRQERDWAARYADIVLTNPDMLHRSLLPRHRWWRDVLAGLRLVVLDEAHHYRGLFGSHVSWVVRRLLRLAAHYGATPGVLLLSATMAEPGATARTLLGRDVEVVTDDGSPSGQMDVQLVDTAAERHGRGQQGWAQTLLADLVEARHPTLCFVRSRRASESIAASVADVLAQHGSSESVAAYRGGYLPEERRDLERRLRSGDLTGVATTNALEMGVDISGMDAVVLSGWPGTRTAFWQQAGRAGRRGRPGLAVFLAGADPLEQYVVRHPQTLLGAPLERTVLDPDNPYVVAPQLCAACAEAPLTLAEVARLSPAARAVVDELTRAGRLRRRPDGWYWPLRERPAERTDIRGSGGPSVRLVEVDTGRLLGTVDGGRAPATVHPGAVYVHQGVTYTVADLDLDDAVALLVRSDPDYETVARSVSAVHIVDEGTSRAWGTAHLALGTVDVTSAVVGYQKRHRDTGVPFQDVALSMPEQRLRTTGVWWTLPDAALDEAGLAQRAWAGAAHAAEHAAIGLLPLFATCDRWDVGGVSTASHPDTGRLTVVVHDAHPGGAGFAARGYEAARVWLTATRDAVAGCGCADGCPACVYSPKCGNGNSPLDKPGAVLLLSRLLSDAG